MLLLPSRSGSLPSFGCSAVGRTMVSIQATSVYGSNVVLSGPMFFRTVFGKFCSLSFLFWFHTPPISQMVLTSATLAPNRAHTTVGPASQAYNTPSVRRVRRWISGWKCSYHVLRWFGTVSAVRRNQGRDAGTTTITPKTPKSFFSHGLFMSRLTGFRDINHSSSRVL